MSAPAPTTAAATPAAAAPTSAASAAAPAPAVDAAAGQHTRSSGEGTSERARDDHRATDRRGVEYGGRDACLTCAASAHASSPRLSTALLHCCAADGEKAEEPTTIADAGVLNKYKEAAKIASDALTAVVKAAANGVAVLDLAKLGDELILERTSKVHTSKKGLSKGVAFPTCISVNNVVGHFAPMEKDQDQPMLQTGDIVKIDLGVQIDGYCAVVAQTIAVPATAGAAATTPIKGRAADAYAACLVAADAVYRSLKPGNKNYPISDLIAQIAKEYNVSPVQGVLSHLMTRNKIDGDKAILNRADPEHKIEEIAFKENEVYGIDIIMSTGEGKPKEVDTRQTTIYKRNAAVSYSLKNATSRKIYSDITTRFASFPFSLRYLEDANKARFGIAEAKEHDMVHGYPVLHEKDGEVVAQIKFTVLITANGTQRITGPVGGMELNPNIVQVEKKFKDYDAELQAALKALTVSAPAAAGAGAAGADGSASSSSAGANAAKNAKKKAAQAKKKAAEAGAAEAK